MTTECKRTVLVIDDDVTQCMLIEDCLIDHGYNVVITDNGVDGFEIATRIAPDLILLDVMLPYVDGFNVCIELGMHSRTARVPVVLMTGLRDQAARDEGRNSGAADFVTKPIDWLKLPQRLENVLAGGSGAWPSS